MNGTVVHIVDDDEPTRDSLCFLLASAGLTAKAYDSATAFLAALPVKERDCLVTDVRMPDMSGIDLLKAVKARQPSLLVIVITGHGDIALAVEAMKLGAADFIEKPYSDETMLAALRSATRLASEPAGGTAERDSIVAKVHTLSPRERQVLEGVVAGKPNKVIAYDLDISPRTVEVYRANLMAKMQASSLSHLVRLALAGGISVTQD